MRSHSLSKNAIASQYRQNRINQRLIDPQNRQVEIYRIGQSPEHLDNPEQLLGEEVLPRFVLELADIWD